MGDDLVGKLDRGDGETGEVLLGSAGGPLAASLLVGDTNAAGAMTLAAGCLIAALALFGGILAALSRRPQPAG